MLAEAQETILRLGLGSETCQENLLCAASNSTLFSLCMISGVILCELRPPLCVRAKETQAATQEDIFVCPLPQM